MPGHEVPSSIADHAFLSNGHGAALVDRAGTMDWLCLPRFDSPACFAALLGDQSHGLWSIAPEGGATRTSQRYCDDTLVVECAMQTDEGSVRVRDCLPLDGGERVEVVRVVEGLSGRVPMRSTFRPRFDYGRHVPDIHCRESLFLAHAGHERAALASTVPMRAGGEGEVCADFALGAGERVVFSMTVGAEPATPRLDVESTLDHCERRWREWAAQCDYRGPWRDMVMRSLLTLKGLIYAPTGGMVAAATTSLPELPGGVRNWDYRYCWLRDAAFTLFALLGNGYRDEARQWRDWLVAAVEQDPCGMRVLYSVDGSTDLHERQLDWLPGYRGSRPVRVGNAACAQFQLDIRGEVMDVLHIARRNGLQFAEEAWEMQLALMDELERRWREPDRGIWEVRGNEAHFVHSKALAWVAFDRGLQMADRLDPARAKRWREAREAIRADIMQHGFDRDRGVFVQRYGTRELDASTLLLPLVGFVPPDSAEATRTVDAIRAELAIEGTGGILRRYRNDGGVDGLPGEEGAFLPCSFWLVNNLALSGRVDEARTLFERLLSLANPVGLLAEEWHPRHGMLGNLPQALTHVGLVNSARILADLERDGARPPHEARPEKRAQPSARTAETARPA